MAAAQTIHLHNSGASTAGGYLPTLLAAPSPPLIFLSSPHSRQTNLCSATARTPIRSVKALAEVAATAGDRGAKLSAWTSIRQERWEGDLAVEGHLPLWLNGIYLRNGAGAWEVGDSTLDHLFDGYATLVRFSFRQGRATGAHRQIESEAYRAAKAHGRPQLTPGWVHSFAVTKYVVVPEMPLRYSASSVIKSEPVPFYAFDWLPASGSYRHVLCRSTGKKVASVDVPPFMAFHFINAYEEKGEDGQPTAVIVDCCEDYADPTILQTLLHKLRSSTNKDELPDSRLGRFRIPLDGSPFGELESALDAEEHGRGMDMCNINPSCLGKKYRIHTLTKIDLLETTAKTWYEEGAVPSEPFFVAGPGETKEDDGVVISIVSDIHGDGYVLVLDATTFQEIALVRLPYGLPYGFHGCWIPGKI